MRHREPSSIAAWMLEHLSPGQHNDALAGDLLEEFRRGRSSGWYWRQVLVAVSGAWSRDVRIHQPEFLFAALWSLLVPSWLLAVADFEQRSSFMARVSQMDWPWPIVGDLGLLLVSNLIFIWAGIAVYLVPHLWVTKNLQFRILCRGLLASFPVLIVLWAALVVLPKRFLLENQTIAPPSMTLFESYPFPSPPDAPGMAQTRRSHPAQKGDALLFAGRSPRAVFSSEHSGSLLVCLPFYVCVLCTLWAATAHSRNPRKRLTT